MSRYRYLSWEVGLSLALSILTVATHAAEVSSLLLK